MAVLAVLVLPLLGRRRHPGLMALIVLGAAWAGVLSGVWQQHLPLALLAPEIMVYTLVVRGFRGRASAAAMATAGYFTVWTLHGRPEAAAGWAAAGYWLSVATVWFIAEYVRARRAYLAEVEQRAQLADSERNALARAAIAEERSRIARELHDVLAHHLGVIVVNAEGARLMQHVDPAVTDRTLELVGTTGRDALKELRRLLEVLHAEGPAPEPTEEQLRELVARAGGNLRTAGSSDGVPAGTMIQAFRIVQEALTNVVKHAGARACVEVIIDFGAPGPQRTLHIAVSDDGGDPQHGPVELPSSGRGLAGIRQRVEMFGGAVQAGRQPTGGYRLSATLPLGDRVSASTAPAQQFDRTIATCRIDHPPLS